MINRKSTSAIQAAHHSSTLSLRLLLNKNGFYSTTSRASRGRQVVLFPFAALPGARESRLPVVDPQRAVLS